jgi:hypothetical protein
MKVYYKGYSESDDGAGTIYIEADEDVVTRQIEVYGDKIYWSTQQVDSDPHHRICDQPVSKLDLGFAESIDFEEFESVWERARRLRKVPV